MMPPIAIVFPIFLLYVWLGWVDTYHGLILLYTAFSLPYVIWMMRGYIEDIPLELEESALVDGCTPLARCCGAWCSRWSRTGLFATAVFTFVFAWNDFIFALVLTRTEVTTYTGPGDALFRRPVEFLGQDRRHVGARDGAGLPCRGDAAALTWCAASRWARSKG